MLQPQFVLDISEVSPVACSSLSASARGELGKALSRLDLLAQVAPFQAVQPGQHDASRIAIVADGYLRLQLASESGRSQIATLFMPGDLIETEIMASGRMFLETVTTARLWVARPGRVASLLSSHPSLGRAFADLRAIKLCQTRWLADALARLTAEERIVCFLVLATRWMPWQPVTANAGLLTVTLPRPDIANLLATSVETICRVLARLDRDRLIDMRTAHCFHLRDLSELCWVGKMAADWQTVRFARPHRTAPALPLVALQDGQIGQPGQAARRPREVPEAVVADYHRTDPSAPKTFRNVATRQ